MTTTPCISPQQNLDRPIRERVVVWLNDPVSSVENKHDEIKSGFIRISSVKRVKREEKYLRKSLKLWMSSRSEINRIENAEQGQMAVTHEEFDDVAGCLQFIRLCDKKCVILILSHYHVQNKEVVSTFKKLPQIACLYRCTTEVGFKQLLKNWFNEGQSFAQDFLPISVAQTPTKDLDKASQLLLPQIFVTELIVNPPRTDEAKKDFIAFCHSKYRNDSAYPTFKEKIEHFDRTYKAENAIQWYTDPESFIYRIVSKTCSTLDITSLFNIRLILRDLYVQLQKLHAEQLDNQLKQRKTVYRGKKLSTDELNRLRENGGLSITRNFLSTSTSKEVALSYSGDGAIDTDQKTVSVLISMEIDRTEMQEKPIAFIGDHSQVGSECEVMLPMGMVFRYVTSEEERTNSKYQVVIKMVRGDNEKQIEKNLSRFHLLTQTGAICAELGMVAFLESTNNSHHVGEYSNLMSHALKSSNIEVAEQLSAISRNYSVPVSAPTNTIDTEENVMLNVSDNKVPNVSQQSSESFQEQHDVKINPKQQLVTHDIINTNHVGTITKVIGTLQTPRARLIIAIITVLVVVSAIATPLVIILSPKTNSTAVCAHISGSFITAVRNPSPNYQVEQLNLTCSQTLVNMSIIQIVQRTFNETNAQQYQTFWNDSTNMTYSATPTEIIYYWYSLPGMLIVQESFPHFIEAQFYYTGGSVRNTSGDTWQIWLQSICRDMLYFYGTY